MKKYNFSYAERCAVWKHHGQKCFLCEEPLRFQDVTIDHLLPETLLEKPSELKRITALYALPERFQINDYCNWVPVHNKCNQKKATTPLPLSPANQIVIDRLIRDCEKIRKIEIKIKNDAVADEKLAKLMVAKEEFEITRRDLGAFKVLNEQEAGFEEECFLHVDPKRWEIIEKRGSIATVTDGRLGGITPIEKNPDITWSCPTCGSYGPWNGVICLSCGRKSDPYD